MQNTYFKTDFESSLAGLVSTSEPNSMMPFNPYGVWLFDGDSASLIDAKNSNQMTEASPTTTTYDNNSMAISSLTGKHIATDVTDVGDVTVMGVAKYSTTGIKVLVGNLLPSASFTKSNWGLFLSQDSLYLTLSSDTGYRDLNNFNLSSPLTTNDYFIFAVSINKTNKTAILYCKNSGIEYTKTAAFTRDYAASGGLIALGDSAYQGSTSGQLTYAETTIYKKALTAAEMQTAAGYIVTRCLERGITI